MRFKSKILAGVLTLIISAPLVAQAATLPATWGLKVTENLLTWSAMSYSGQSGKSVGTTLYYGGVTLETAVAPTWAQTETHTKLMNSFTSSHWVQ